MLVAWKSSDRLKCLREKLKCVANEIYAFYAFKIKNMTERVEYSAAPTPATAASSLLAQVHNRFVINHDAIRACS